MIAEWPSRREFLRLGAASAVSPLLAGATGGADPLDDVRRQAAKYIDEGLVPSLSVAVFLSGKPVWVEAFGWADRARQLRATAATPYAIASVSKPFTGTIIAQLIVSGVFTLDAPIAKYLGDSVIADDGRTVTLRQALQHRSGIPRHWRNFFAGQGRPPPFSHVAGEHAFVTAAHGQRYLYSNMNYGLLAEAVEKLGKPFHRHLREAIFEPLQLHSAGFLADHFHNWRAAVPYEEDGAIIEPYLVDEMGARDLVMTASDLARFGVAHLDGRLRAVAGLMLSDRAEIGAHGAGKASYGLGWVVEEESPAALFSFGHTGEGPGAASSLTIIPSERLVVATVANAQGPPAYVLNEAIVDALSSRFAERRKAHPFQSPVPDEPARQRLQGQWIGSMETSSARYPVAVEIALDAKSTIKLADEPIAKLTRLSVASGVFSARAEMSLPIAEARRSPHQVRLMLDVTGSELDGAIVAFAHRGKVRHDTFWLSYRLRLLRK